MRLQTRLHHARGAGHNVTLAHHRVVHMATPLTQPSITRLAYIRYLYQEGVEASRRPGILAASALLAFHDAVENFLGLAAEHTGANINPRITFMEYWGTIKQAGLDLPGKATMSRLNDARVGLKHHGNFPAQQTIDQSREAVLNFFTLATPMVFDVDFETIDMVDLVTVPDAACLLREAHTHAMADDITMALTGLRMAFNEVLNHCTGQRIGGVRSPFVFGNPLPNFSKAFIPSQHLREPWCSPLKSHDKQVEALHRAVTPMRHVMTVLSLGINYANYTRFDAMTPETFGQGRFAATKWQSQLNRGDYEFCRTFVIESALTATSALEALRLQDARLGDYDGGEAVRQWSGPRESEVAAAEDPTSTPG